MAQAAEGSIVLDREDASTGQFPAKSKPFRFVAGGQNTIMANFTESRWEDMEQKTPDEFRSRERHSLLFVMVTIIPPRKSNAITIKAQDSLIGNGDPMSITTEVFHNTGNVLKRWFAINDPLLLIEGRIQGESVLFEKAEEFAAELSGQDLYGKKEFLFRATPTAIMGQSAASNNAVDMRMEHKVLPPGMQNSGNTGNSAEISVVGAQLQKCF